jgi:hypothetical protein
MDKKAVSRFLYPVSRQFPFDEICEKIVREAEKRDWRIPEFEFIFDTYGPKNAQLKYLSEMYGPNFYLRFCRTQGSLSYGFDDLAAVTEISIPRMEIHVYEDESGPKFYNYIGSDWEADKKDFMGRTKIHSKLDKKPRSYLLYEGGCTKPDLSDNQFRYKGERPPYLVNDDDCGREYSAEENEPKYYETEKIFIQLTNWLESNVLVLIMSE